MLQVPSILDFVSNPGAQPGTAGRLQRIDATDFIPARQQYRRVREAHALNVTGRELIHIELLLKLFYAAVVLGLSRPVPSELTARFWLADRTAGDADYLPRCLVLFGGSLVHRVAPGVPDGLLAATREHYAWHFRNLPEGAVPDSLAGGVNYSFAEVEPMPAPGQQLAVMAAATVSP